MVVSSDEMGRALMQPGQAAYTEIVNRFGVGVVLPDGALDRRELARLAFEAGRVEELNATVHPAVLAEQARVAAVLERERPDAILVVESALIFTTKYKAEGRPWRERFDRIVMVTAPETVKVARFVERASNGRALSADERAALENDARRRLAAQAPTRAFEAECLLVRNDAGLEALEARVEIVWAELLGLNGGRERRGMEG